MKKNKNYLALTSGLIMLAVIVWFSTSNCGGDTFEIKPEISVPIQRTDAVHAIDAYERMMERFMDANGRNLAQIGIDVRDIVTKLDSIDSKLSKLSTRMARIEKRLGIKPIKHEAGTPKQPQPASTEQHKKVSPAVTD